MREGGAISGPSHECKLAAALAAKAEAGAKVAALLEAAAAAAAEMMAIDRGRKRRARWSCVCENAEV